MDSFSADFFTANRMKLAARCPDMLIFIPAHARMQYSADTHFPFRQESNFWYLCGNNEPDLVMVLDTRTVSAEMLVPRPNDYQVEWDGAFDNVSLQQHSGISMATEGDMKDMIATCVARAHKDGLQIGYLAPMAERVEPFGFYSNPARKIIAGFIEVAMKKSRIAATQLIDIRPEIARLRQIKQPIELTMINRAIEATKKSLDIAHTLLPSSSSEKDIERALSMHFHEYADGYAFEPIIASGKNAATIHYNANQDILHKNAMLLLDVGAQYHNYAADISRTWAVGTPTKRQQAIHRAVCDIQDYAMTLLAPGVLLGECQKLVEAFSATRCKELGIVQDPYPHGISHFLGIDVHDAGVYADPLQENMVLTVEPGIYLAEEGIGVRIEDDVRITANGIENLSKDIRRELVY